MSCHAEKTRSSASNRAALVGKALAQALGLRTAHALPRNRAIDDLRRGEIEKLQRAIDRRFIRRVDPQSGGVTIEVAEGMDGPAHLAGMAQILSTEARGLRSTLGEAFDIVRLDPCVDTVCDDDLVRAMRQCEFDVDALIDGTDAGADEDYLGELVDRAEVAIYAVENEAHKKFNAGSFGGQLFRSRLEFAKRRMELFKNAVGDKKLATPAADAATEIEACARCILEAVDDIRQLADELGLSECDLKHAGLDLCLDITEREWTALAALAGAEDILDIERLAERAEYVAEDVLEDLPNKADSLPLGGDEKEHFRRLLDRLKDRATKCWKNITPPCATADAPPRSHNDAPVAPPKTADTTRVSHKRTTAQAQATKPPSGEESDIP